MSTGGSSASTPVINPYDKTTLDCVAWNVLLYPCCERARREHLELPEDQQNQIWTDLTGKANKVHLQIQYDKVASVSADEENPILVQESLLTLQVELEKYTNTAPSGNNDSDNQHEPSKKASAYNLALERYPSYVKAPSFLLKFLRAERFDVKATSERILLHFKEKLELFGFEKLGREIKLSDLDEDDMDSMNRGYIQVLPLSDHSNRLIVFYYKAVTGCYRKRENLLRTAWYIFNKISQDETCQKSGIVNVVYNNGGFPDNGMDYEKSRRISGIFKAIPIRFDSFLVCLDDSPWLTVVDTFSIIVNKFIRLRLRAIPGK